MLCKFLQSAARHLNGAVRPNRNFQKFVIRAALMVGFERSLYRTFSIARRSVDHLQEELTLHKIFRLALS